MIQYRELETADNASLAGIIRSNLEKYHLDIPGTAYYDAQLDNLSEYYSACPEKRIYMIAYDEENRVIGGVGIAEYESVPGCAELQKLYLVEEYKGLGYGKKLVELAEKKAGELGYTEIYLETHTNLQEAISLYEKMNYEKQERPLNAVHSTMDCFFHKLLS